MPTYNATQIAEFDRETLEAFAANLSWEGGRYDRQSMTQFRTQGYPHYYDSKPINSREEFLRARLLKSKQDTWNREGAIERAEERRKEAEERAKEKARLEAEEAAKPKIEVEVEHSVYILLKDRRATGSQFKIRVKGEYVRMNQHKSGKVGRRICDQEGQWDKTAFIDAITLMCSDDAPSRPDLNGSSDALKYVIGVELQGLRNKLVFERDGNTLFVHEPGSLYNDSEKWHFNIADMETLRDALKREYTVTVREAGTGAVEG